MNFGAITYEQYMANREQLAVYIESALQPGAMSLDELENAIRALQMLPVGIFEDKRLVGLMVLEQTQDAIHVTTLAGDLPRGWLKKTYAFVADLARHEHKPYLQCAGRRGWLKRLKEYNMSHEGDLIRVEI